MGKASRKAPSAMDGDGAPAPHAPATKEAFARYRDELLGRVPDDIKARFIEGGFCKWGKEWLPVLELGPFDVAPGPVRDMWLDMFAKSQEQGRGMKRLVYWYGVEPGDRGMAHSFVNATQLIDWKQGKREGHHNIPQKIQSKIARNIKLTNAEEQQQRGLIELKVDMELEKTERAMWMRQFKEDYEVAGEAADDVKPKPKRKAIMPKKEKVEQSSPSKRARRAAPQPSPVSSMQSAKVKSEPTRSTGKGGKAESGIPGQKPTPEECRLVVQELGKLHPDIIALNDQRRELFALQSGSRDNGNDTPITDAVISTMLSQNTTASNQDRAFAALKKAYPSWERVANEMNRSRIEDAIRVAGLAQIRAERMQSMLQTVQAERGVANFEYLAHFSSSEEIQKELSRFKGMGPKTISCIMLFALGMPDFPVDTHVLRISKQMGWISSDLTRETAYQYLNGQVQDEFKLDLHCLLVTHGKQCNKCAARGRAQFGGNKAAAPVQWVCPMGAIKSGKLACSDDAANPFALDKKPAAVKEETDVNRLYRC